MSDFKKLKVWQKAHILALDIHRLASKIRGNQNAALRAQIVRAAQSIATNIVEGSGQRSAREFARYLRTSLNSSTELEYHLITGRDTGAIPGSTYVTKVTQVIEVRKMLYGLIRYLDKPSDDPEADRST